MPCQLLGFCRDTPKLVAAARRTKVSVSVSFSASISVCRHQAIRVSETSENIEVEGLMLEASLSFGALSLIFHLSPNLPAATFGQGLASQLSPKGCSFSKRGGDQLRSIYSACRTLASLSESKGRKDSSRLFGPCPRKQTRDASWNLRSAAHASASAMTINACAPMQRSDTSSDFRNPTLAPPCV